MLTSQHAQTLRNSFDDDDDDDDDVCVCVCVCVCAVSYTHLTLPTMPDV